LNLLKIQKGKNMEKPIPSKPIDVKIQAYRDNRGGFVHRAEMLLDKVREEHVYLVYRSSSRDVVIEADLLGDQAVINSDGKLPPVIHIECPKCSSDKDRSILSIEYENKKFEIEDLDPKDWGTVPHPDGGYVMGTDGQPVIIERRLTVKERFSCAYCYSSFRITDNIMSDA
jgi:hypothetical protein